MTMSKHGKKKHWTHQQGIANSLSRQYDGKTEKFYVVFVGRMPGIYRSWGTCKEQVDGYANARYRSYPDETSAIKALKGFATPNPEIRHSKKPDPIIKSRAKMILSKGGNKHFTTCTAVSCTYPKCLCSGS